MTSIVWTSLSQQIYVKTASQDISLMLRLADVSHVLKPIRTPNTVTSMVRSPAVPPTTNSTRMEIAALTRSTTVKLPTLPTQTSALSVSPDTGLPQTTEPAIPAPPFQALVSTAKTSTLPIDLPPVSLELTLLELPQEQSAIVYNTVSLTSVSPLATSS